MTEFRKMRRAAQELDHEACLDMIRRATSGVLSVVGDEGYPYGVPMSFVYVESDQNLYVNVTGSESSRSDEATGTKNDEGSFDGRFYFHCAKTGHKIDAIRACDKACFTIIDRDDVVADEFTTYFKSVVAFGRVRILETPEEIMPAIQLLAGRYSPDESEEKKAREIEKEMPALAMLEFTVEHMTGKEAIELVRKRRRYE
ncbi:MAG: pyridoxamine 5'-phosphate oxidase family protein [Eubacterium sp.]|nr:pyridoxamine 5'-phosphate oxidase family protein [Eubacterium sp.]